MAFLEFLGSQAGRGVRVAAGLALIVAGVLLGGAWLALSVIGLLPVALRRIDLPEGQR